MLNLKQWIEADTDQRSRWLADGEELDDRSRQVLNWGVAFKAREDDILAVYLSTSTLMSR